MIYGKFTDNGKEDLGIMLGIWGFSPTDKKKTVWRTPWQQKWRNYNLETISDSQVG